MRRPQRVSRISVRSVNKSLTGLDQTPAGFRRTLALCLASLEQGVTMNSFSPSARSEVAVGGSAYPSDFEWLVGEIVAQIRREPCRRRDDYIDWAVCFPLARISEDVNALDIRRRGDALRALAEAGVDAALQRLMNPSVARRTLRCSHRAPDLMHVSMKKSA